MEDFYWAQVKAGEGIITEVGIKLPLTKALGSGQQMRKQKFRVVRIPSITRVAAESGHKPRTADSQSSAHPGPDSKKALNILKREF